MRWIKAIFIAFSTYARIPVPNIEWDDAAVKLALAFLPLVGVFIGAAMFFLEAVCRFLGIGAVLYAALATVLPILITGGIHMDGYCDTSDALAAWRGRERALEILKDTHTGAFAVIRYGMYILVSFGLFSELYMRDYSRGLTLVYVISRSFGALSAVTMPNARKSGMLATFTEKADSRAVIAILAAFLIISSAGFIYISFAGAIAGLILCVPVTLWYSAMAKKRFGGVTGDTSGFYQQLIELALIFGLLGGNAILKLI